MIPMLTKAAQGQGNGVLPMHRFTVELTAADAIPLVLAGHRYGEIKVKLLLS
jgi:hypothetical protein